MGFATHLGPWLLGTVKETTGTTPGTVRNTGMRYVCTVVPRLLLLRWRLFGPKNRTLPVLVTLIRFAKPLCVFCFGI